MSLLNFAREEVVVSTPSATVLEAVERMARENVGCLVVVQEGTPVGILTDRDVVMRVTGCGADPAATTVGEVMTPDPITLDEELGLFEALEIMKDKGVRRFPVIDPHGVLSGFFTVDDVLYLLGLELSAVARIVEHDVP